MIDERFGFYGRGWQNTVPGMVRMDRAVLYLRQRLRAIVTEIEGRSTKSIGDGGFFQIRRFAGEAISIARMSGDQQLAAIVDGTAAPLSPRTARRDALNSLRELISQLETYQAPAEGKTATVGLDDASAGAQTKVSDKDLESEKTVFVIMPFAAEFTDVWKGGIQRAAQSEGFNPIRVDYDQPIHQYHRRYRL